MAAAYRSSTTSTTGGSAAANLSLNVPAGVQPNDLLVASITTDGGTGATITPPGTWTLIMTATQSTNQRISVYGRVATGYEQASYSWGFDTTRMAAGSIAAYSGAHPFMPFGTGSTTTTASTTVGGAGGNSTYTGLQVKMTATNNATASSNIATPAASFTKVLDVCTTASTFIGLAAQHVTKGLTWGGMNTGTSTCSQTVNSVEVSICIEDARPPFNYLIDEANCVGSVTASRTNLSITMQTNYPNTVLIALVSICKDVATISSITATGLTWQLVTRVNTQAGSTEIWSAFSPTPFSNKTITFNFSTSIVSANFTVTSFVGADISGTNGSGAIGAVATTNTTAAAPSVNLTTTRDNSWVWAVANTGTAAPGGTNNPGTGQSVLRQLNDTTNACGSWVWRQNSLTAISGTTVTSNITSPTTDNCNVAAIEILPAIRKNLGTTGISA